MEPHDWLHHPEFWCLETITVGCVTYTQNDAFYILRHSTGDKTYAMGSELIAIQLAMACRGADTSCISSQLAQANSWLCMHPIGSGVHGGDAVWHQIEPVYKVLKKYNQGKICVPECRDAEGGHEPPRTTPTPTPQADFLGKCFDEQTNCSGHNTDHMTCSVCFANSGMSWQDPNSHVCYDTCPMNSLMGNWLKGGSTSR